MGYHTNFEGQLKFKRELTASQLALVQQFMGEDCRNHPEWDEPELTYVDLKITPDLSGIMWDGSEKTYDMVDAVNMITRIVRKTMPEFELTGSLLAQGENIDDRWTLIMKDGIATKVDTPRAGQKYICPNCECDFYIEDAVEVS